MLNITVTVNIIFYNLWLYLRAKMVTVMDSSNYLRYHFLALKFIILELKRLKNV